MSHLRFAVVAAGVIAWLGCDSSSRLKDAGGTGGGAPVDAAQTGGTDGGIGGGGATGSGGASGSGGSIGSGGATGGGGGRGGDGLGGLGGGGASGGHDGCIVPAGCCSSDADCLPTEECVNPTVCAAGQMAGGVCKPKPTPITACWRNEDCAFRVCFGAQVCPCGAACLVADKLGGCGMP